MWLSVLVPDKGLTCIELLNCDPDVLHVKDVLGLLLQKDLADCDLFLGGEKLEDSAMLSDFDMTSSCDYVTLLDRRHASASDSASRKHASQTNPCEQSASCSSRKDIVRSTLPPCNAHVDDPIDQCSPSILELDPIESTPRQQPATRLRISAARRRVRRKATMEGQDVYNEKLGFPKWEGQRD